MKILNKTKNNLYKKLKKYKKAFLYKTFSASIRETFFNKRPT